MDFDEKRGNEANFSLNPEERFLIDMLSQIKERLKQKYLYSDEEIYKLGDSSLSIPITIFAGTLSPAEALTKFLKENHDLSYKEISELIGRNKKSLWGNYRKAIKKMPWPLEIKESITVPVSIFNSENSILESLIFYLKDVRKMHNKKIAQLLNKNPANIWTTHNRAKKKENGKQ